MKKITFQQRRASVFNGLCETSLKLQERNKIISSLQTLRKKRSKKISKVSQREKKIKIVWEKKLIFYPIWQKLFLQSLPSVSGLHTIHHPATILEMCCVRTDVVATQQRDPTQTHSKCFFGQKWAKYFVYWVGSACLWAGCASAAFWCGNSFFNCAMSFQSYAMSKAHTEGNGSGLT